MDKKALTCLGALARVDYWADSGTTTCPFCGMSWRGLYGHVSPIHEDDCPVKEAERILQKEGIYV